MASVIISHELPDDLVVLSQEAIDQIDEAIESAIALCDLEISPESFALSNDAYKRLQQLASTLEAQRKAIKAPVIALGRLIDDAPKEYVANMDDARGKLGARIRAFEIAENAKREAARKEAEAEARRIEQAAYEKAERERAAAIEHLPPGVEPPNVVDAVIVKPVAPAYTPPALKSAVKDKVSHELIIDDIDLIPVKYGDIRLLVPDEKAIKALQKMKVQIPGCRLVEIKGTMAKGGAA